MTKPLFKDVQQVSIASLREHPRNARQGDVGLITESIKANGVYRPLVVQKSTGYVLAGNHTLKALRALGAEVAPVVYVDVDDDRALRILLVDNRANDQAAYDDQRLADLLQELRPTPLALAGTGYDLDALDTMLSELAKPLRLNLDRTPPRARCCQDQTRGPVRDG